MVELGDKILKALDEIERQGVTISYKKSKSGEDTYTFGDERYKISVTVDPKHWLGLEFELHKSRIFYPINTDVYPIADLEHRWFADAIEKDIVDFLKAFKYGKAKIAYNSGRPMLIVPLKDEFVFMKQGRLLSPTSRHKLEELDKIESKSEFKQFKI